MKSGGGFDEEWRKWRWVREEAIRRVLLLRGDGGGRQGASLEGVCVWRSEERVCGPTTVVCAVSRSNVDGVCC